jgi:hypothetical protein
LKNRLHEEAKAFEIRFGGKLHRDPEAAVAVKNSFTNG